MALSDEVIVLLSIFGAILLLVLLYWVITRFIKPYYYLTRKDPNYGKVFVTSVHSEDQPSTEKYIDKSIGNMRYSSSVGGDARVTVQESILDAPRRGFTQTFKKLFQ
jgi:hypothetical protein